MPASDTPPEGFSLEVEAARHGGIAARLVELEPDDNELDGDPQDGGAIDDGDVDAPGDDAPMEDV